MKTAVSINDEVFREAEALAQELNTSRSQLYSQAVAEFIERRRDERVLAQIADIVAHEGDADRDFVRAAGRGALQHGEW